MVGTRSGPPIDQSINPITQLPDYPITRLRVSQYVHRPEYRPEREIRVHARHSVVSHDSETPVERFEAIGRVRFDHIGNAEEQEGAERAGPRDRGEPQRDEHPGDLVDDDVPR